MGGVNERLSRRMLAALDEAPGTSANVAESTGLPLRLCSAVLSRMWKEGRVERSKGRVWPDSGVGCGAFVYSRKTFRPWTTKEERMLRELSGSRRDVIAAKLGRTQRAITNRAQRIGVELSGPIRGRWDDGAKARVRRLRAEGVPVRVLSRCSGIPTGTIKHWLYDDNTPAAKGPRYLIGAMG